MSENNDIRFGS